MDPLLSSTRAGISNCCPGLFMRAANHQRTSEMTRRQYPRGVSKTHECVFKSQFVREQIDPRIKSIWPDAPFGNLRRLWREQSCAETNPYDSEWCPYSTEDCALAFF